MQTAPKGAVLVLTKVKKCIIIYCMYEIIKTSDFHDWLRHLKDQKAKRAISVHIERMILGNFGMTRQVAGDIYEKKINISGGYRFYYFIKAGRLIIVLNGGTKRTQQRDIEKAKRLRKEIIWQ